ncbi:class I SAM-dependent methyltransferase [Candidatus Parcubacteria bacterium]|nr:MAG: class I SAM-dependent methyltransferase [Candidatus Parcubacteria bacterium]
MHKSETAIARTTCRVCGSNALVPILSLGELYVSNFVDEATEGAAFKAPLDVVLCATESGGCGLLQLKHTVSHEAMYRNYWYRSGMNLTMTEQLKDVAQAVERIVDLRVGDYVVDIGANDGTLLRSYTAQGLKRTGFEPAHNLEKWNVVGTTKVINDFFSYDSWTREFGAARAKAVTAIAMFYDLEDPNKFVADVKKLLHDEGIFVIQMSYLPLMLSQNAFDNICHEHVEYYSLLSLENLLTRHGLEVCDVELNDVNGGSFRTYIRHSRKGAQLRIPQEAEARIKSLRKAELSQGIHRRDAYGAFVDRVLKIKDRLRSFIEEEAGRGKKVYVYGASTKGNTLLQFFGLDHRLIEAAAERNPDKWGKKTVGTKIPIISEEQARKEKPDYFLILPWHFLKEFKERESDFLRAGGRFIVPLPSFKVIGAAEE